MTGVMTRITLKDGAELLADIQPAQLAAAIGTGTGKVGVRDAQTQRWHWVRLSQIREIDGRPPAHQAAHA
jgi:hypothetical protein